MQYYDAKVVGDIPDDIANLALTIAHGTNAKDMNFVNRTTSLFDFCVSMTKFERGVKDGHCILSGAVVPPASGAKGTRREAVNMTSNYIVMVDFDQGDYPEQVIEKVIKLGLLAIVWTTHSHLKPITPIPEKAVVEWLRKKGTPNDAPTNEQVIDYFKATVKIYPEFLDNLKVLRKEIIIGGMHFMCEHAPLPKCRALFFLDRKFDFANRGGTQQQAMEEWKERYAGFCDKILEMQGWDHACMDPSRLMYVPRISSDADIAQHAITIVAGKLLDFEAVERIDKRSKDTRKPTLPGLPGFVSNVNRTDEGNGVAAENSSASAGDPNALKTAWLPRFLRDHAHDFEVEDWLKSVSDPDRAYQCPWADMHTRQDGEDKGFKAWNASLKDGDGGFGLQCSHNGCRTDLARGMRPDGKQDRAKYLDALITQHGATQAQLIEFCPHAEEEAAAKEAEAAAERNVVETETRAGDDDAANEARIRAFTPETPFADIEGMVRLLARRPKKEHARVGNLLTLLAQKTRQRRPDLMTALSGFRAEFRAQELEAAALVAAANGGEDDPTMSPPEDLTAFVPLWPGLNEAWTEKIVHLSTLRQLERFNKELPCPRLFNRPEGGVMRATRNQEGALVVEEMHKDAWHYEISNVVQYKKSGLSGRKHTPVPASVVSYVIGSPDKDFPTLERVIRIPVISEQGIVVTEPGYDAGMRCYLDPNFTPFPVSKRPDATELNKALDLIEEALTDFPFSDIFNGDDQEDIKSDVVDNDGHPLPNFERGRASRANMMALILQPFVQHLIKGSCPAYHIDKASPGSGAGYLTDVAFMIAEGTRAVVNTMSDSNEEFKKSITATLRQGAPIIFIDNINRKVDSGALAAALTSGVWNDRILGVSDNAKIEVKCAWVLAGNNLSFSSELMRRNVPIRLDAKTPNPALDRPKSFFKHHPLQDWLMEMRPALVWACLTIVAHWFARGRPVGKTTMNSFDHWAAIMGGILESAGIEGFLSNIPAYLAEKNDDDVGTSDFVQALWTQFGDKEFTSAMALAAAKDPFGNVLYGIPIDTDKKETSVLAWWGKWLPANIAGRTYRVTDPSTPTTPTTPTKTEGSVGVENNPFNVTWVIRKAGSSSKHALIRVKAKAPAQKQVGVEV